MVVVGPTQNRHVKVLPLGLCSYNSTIKNGIILHFIIVFTILQTFHFNILQKKIHNIDCINKESKFIVYISTFRFLHLLSLFCRFLQFSFEFRHKWISKTWMFWWHPFRSVLRVHLFVLWFDLLRGCFWGMFFLHCLLCLF